MRILVSGATGLTGSALVPLLSAGGHEIVRLVRSNPQVGDIPWDAGSRLEPSAASGFDAVIHLAGETISKRWTDAQRKKVRNSRVIGTRNLVYGLINADAPPQSFLCASAVGIYGDRGDETLDESAAPGKGFLVDVAQEWEAETKPAADAGMRVVNLRSAMVLSAQGGALAPMLPLFRLGLGGRMGSGEQYWSWIAISDWIRSVYHILSNDKIVGPVNLSSPNPVTNREFTITLAKLLRRPAILPAPAFGLRLFLGPMADELILASAKVVPGKLLDSGFSFRFPELELALREVLEKPKHSP